MVMVFYSDVDDPASWEKAVRSVVADLEMRVWPDIGDPSEIETALVWKPPKGMLQNFPNLKAIFSLAAGIDAMLEDDTLPDVPLCRMIDATLTRGMSEYVLYQVLRFYRLMDVYEKNHQLKKWEWKPSAPPEDINVGIMGLGELGQDALKTLKPFGFSLSGWSRSHKTIDGVNTFAGTQELPAFLKGADILVCLLPLTPQTEGILNRPLFDQLRDGTCLIHAGRGGHLVEEDLIAALRSGRLRGAVLDVTPAEPLEKQSPLWDSPNLFITPHAASYTHPSTGGINVGKNLLRLRRGERLAGLVERQRGY